MQNRYEITFLVKPGTTNEDVLSVLAQNNATIDATSDVGERELAYTIAKHDRAHYWSVLFTCDPSVLVKIEKALRIKKDLLRFLIISRLREAEKPVAKPKTEIAKTTGTEETKPAAKEKSEVKIEKVEEKKEVEPVEVPKTVKKVTKTKKTAVAASESKTEPEKKPAKPKAKKKEFSSEELNKKLEELVKED